MTIGNPGGAELVEAVTEFLEAEVMTAVSAGDVKFKLRIALNLLGLVERELRLGPGQEAAERAHLQALLGSDEASLERLNAELCRRIRDGLFEGRMQVLLDRLMPITLDRLAIDNPRYSTYLALRASD